MSCVEVYNITDFNDDINYMYHKIIQTNLLFSGLVLLTTFTNMSLLISIKSKLIDIKNTVYPPLYKSTESNY